MYIATPKNGNQIVPTECQVYSYINGNARHICRAFLFVGGSVADVRLVVAVVAVALDDYCVERGVDLGHLPGGVGYIGCRDVVLKVF